MKKQLSLTELAREIESRKESKQDFVARASQIAMQADGASITVDATGKGINQVLTINDHAHSQLGTRLGVPAAYYNRMKDNAPALLADNVNHWLSHDSKRKHMVRTYNGDKPVVRAFLSDRYQRIENEEIAQVVLPLLLDHGTVHIDSCAITESKMYIKAVFPKTELEVKKGDVVQAGVIISNSEVGAGAVNVQPLIFRLVCENGLIINDAKMSARHIGGRVTEGEDVYEMLSDKTKAADDHVILMKVQDVVRSTMRAAWFSTQVRLMQDATGQKIEGKVEEAVKVLSRKVSLTELEGESVLRHLIEGADLSRYGVMNAVTRAAQDVESYDRSTEMEMIGHKILTLRQGDWRHISEAA